MEKQNNKIIAFLIGILVLLMINIGWEIYHLFSYEKQKENGNLKWKEVEQRIVQLEERVDNIIIHYEY